MADPWFSGLMALPPTICGRKLLPFSLAHALVLRKLGSPYAIGGQRAAEDLFLALEICSRPFAALPQLLAQPPSLRALQRHSSRWRRNVATAGASFERYLEDFMAAPARYDQDGTGGAVRSPAEWYIASILISEYGMTEAQAWDCGYGRARCYIATYFERNGDDSLLPETEAGLFEIMARANELAARGMQAEADRLYAQIQQAERRSA